MKAKNYTFKPGARLKTKIKPNEVHAELERIRKKKGLTRRTIVDESAPKSAKLHGEFTWNDKLAADKYRLSEAGNIIQVVHVVYEDGPEEPQRSIVVQETIDKETNYAPVHVVLERRDTRDALILNLIRDAQSFRRRLILVSELSHVVPVIDELISKMSDAATEEEELKPKRKRAN